MPKKLHKILAINPGSKYVGIAVFAGHELIDWRVRVIKGKWSATKLQRIILLVHSFIDRYQPDVLAIKRLHRSRGSANLKQLVSRIKQLSKRKRLRIYQFSIKELENFFSPQQRINKAELAAILTSRYPELLSEFNKEQSNKNRYHIRMFEAVALGAVCSHQLDKN